MRNLAFGIWEILHKMDLQGYQKEPSFKEGKKKK